MKFIHDPEWVVHNKNKPFDVYIGRPSIWGNPFVLKPGDDRQDIVCQYHDWIIKQPELMKRLPELRGKKLGCWCSPKLCHGDVLRYLICQIQFSEIFGERNCE